MFRNVPPRLALAVLGGASAAIAATATRQFWSSGPKIYPLENRVYFPVRYQTELDPLIALPVPLLVNFTTRHDPLCDQLTGALHRIVTKETDKVCRLVDVEAEEPTMRDTMVKYQIPQIPTIMAIRGGLPQSYYSPPRGQEIDWADLKSWIEKNSIDR